MKEKTIIEAQKRVKGTATKCYCVFVDSQPVIQSDSASFAMLGANPTLGQVL